MVGKLIKHEFRATGRTMLPVLGALLALAALANLSFRGLETLDNSFLELPMIFAIVLFFLGLFAAVVMAVVVMVQRFHKNLLGDEGYLTLTLPANEHSHIWAKLLTATVWIVAATLLAVALFLLTVLHLDRMSSTALFVSWPSAEEFRRALAEVALRPWDLWRSGLLLALMALLGVMLNCLHFYAAMALGHCFNKNKMLLSVVFFFAVSFGFRLLSTVLAAVTRENVIIVLNSLNSATEIVELLSVLDRLFLTAIGEQLLRGAILYFLTAVPLKRGLNLG